MDTDDLITLLQRARNVAAEHGYEVLRGDLNEALADLVLQLRDKD